MRGVEINSNPSTATNFILTDQEESRMNAALSLIEEALDYEEDDDGGGEDYNECDDGRDAAKLTVMEEDFKSLRSQERDSRRDALFRSALSIQESVVGFFHPEVANTYHYYGWFLYESGRVAFALVYFLRALRICHRLYGSEHSSVKILLNDIQLLVYEMQVGDSSKVQDDCYAIFDSWIYQNFAERSLVVHNNPCAAMAWYREALELLPTTRHPASQTCPHGVDGALESHKCGEVCFAELERAFVHLQMAGTLQKIVSESTSDSLPSYNRSALGEASDLYCKSLSVLSRWLDSEHPTLRYAQDAASQTILEAALRDEEFRRLKRI